MSVNRKTKIMTIVALIIAIASMSLGFAAFSSVLNISSSATVSPNSEDFKLRIYGFESVENFSLFMSKFWSREFDDSLVSNSVSVPIDNEGNYANGSLAYIDNSTLSISNMNINFDDFSSESIVQYAFVLKNEGKYTAYLDEDMINFVNGDLKYKCEPLEGTTPGLAYEACDVIETIAQFVNTKFEYLDVSNFQIKPNEFVIFAFGWKLPDYMVIPDGQIKYTIEKFKF